MVIGSRAQVFHGTADKTSGGLTKKDLKKSASGKIVSIAASKKAKKRFTKTMKKLFAESREKSPLFKRLTKKAVRK